MWSFVNDDVKVGAFSGGGNAPPGTGTIFYVDATSGNDSNSGLSSTVPWRTLNKVNTSTFTAGAQILFKGGELWRELLIPPSSGSAGNPIIFGKYSGGADPVFCGADVTALTWTDTGGNVWRAVRATDPGTMRINGTVGTEKTLLASLAAPNDWFWDSGASRVYLYSTSDPGGKTVEMSARGECIAMVTSYVVIDSITTEMADGTLGNILLTTAGANNITIRNSESRYTTGAGILVYTDAGASQLVYNCDLHDCEWGIIGYIHTASGAGTEVVVKRNECYNNRTSGILCRANRWIIDSNHVYSNGNTIDASIGLHIYAGSAVEGTGVNNTIINNTVHNNTGGTFDGGGIALDQFCDNNTISNNTVYSNRSYGISTFDDSTITISNNTCYGNVTDNTLTLGEITLVSSAPGESSNLTITGNNGRATFAWSVGIYVDGNTNGSAGLSITGNNWFNTTANNWYDNAGARGTNLATWNAFGFVGTDTNNNVPP